MITAKILKKVRVRFAPSPTGFLHIGGLRTALYNYLFAKKHGGTFVLRIEDTDRTRAVAGGVENIIRTLEWCGIVADAGLQLVTPPNLPFQRGGNESLSPPFGGGVRGGVLLEDKGEYGPYTQSQRLEIYRKHAEKLVKKGKAYYCVCTPERLEQVRQAQIARKEMPRYDRLCREQETRNKKQGISVVIRLKVPEEGSTRFTDIIRGEVKFENALIDDQVLLKSDGFPTYHLANVVDDYLMKITHVIRGEEWLPSTPKHVLLYKAFNWKPPQFAHLPLLLNADHSKLSKRQGDVAVEDYIKKGYLRETLLNFVALLGWNPRGDQELYTIDELIAQFDLAKVNKSGAVVNFEKLEWMNGHYIRSRTVDELAELCAPYFIDAGYSEEIRNPKSEIRNRVRKVVALEQERLKKLSDIVSATEFFFVDQPHYHAEMLQWKKMSKADATRALNGLQDFFAIYKGTWDAKILEDKVKTWIANEGRGVGETLWPMRVALSGRLASPPPFEIAAILGKEKTAKRIEYALQLAKTR